MKYKFYKYMKVGVFMDGEFEKLEKEMRYLQEKLKLLSWEINLHFVSADSLEVLMDVECEGCNLMRYEYMKSDIYIDQDRDNKLEILVHEMLHLVFFDLNIKFEDMSVCERTINMLNNLIMELYCKEEEKVVVH